MKDSVYKVLVPTDFTTVADYAIEHAAKIASIFDGEIHLLHVVSKQKEIDDAKEKLYKKAEESAKKYGVKTEIIVRIGNIFDDIGDVASEIGARLIVMGTHGVKGIQHLVGSYALKVITHSKVPFIVVQEKGVDEDGYQHIVLPIDATQETKQKLQLTTNMAKNLGAKVHMFHPKETDEFRVKKLFNELRFAKKYLGEREVEFDVQEAPEKGDFISQTIQYSAAVNADLIAIVNRQDSNMLPDWFQSGEEQTMIGNEAKIPVIIMNPTQEFLSGSVLFS